MHVLMLRLRRVGLWVVLVVRVLWGRVLRRMGHAHWGRDGDTLRDNRGCRLVDGHLTHLDALRRVEFVARGC